MFVADASITLAWFLDIPLAADMRKSWETASRSLIVVPAIWFMETQNGILKLIRQRRLDAVDAGNIRLELALLSKRVDTEFTHDAIDRTWELANKHMLTFYDACYLELAWRLDVPLASLDSALCRAAKTMKISLH